MFLLLFFKVEAEIIDPVHQTNASVVRAKLGATVNMQCSASGCPLPSIEWMHEARGGEANRLVRAVRSVHSKAPFLLASHLQLVNVSKEQRGRYRCYLAGKHQHQRQFFLVLESMGS